MSPADNPLLAAGRPSRKLAAVTPMHLLRAMCLVLGLLLALLAPGLAKAAPAAGPLGALQGTLGGGSASDKERSNAIQAQLDAAASATKEADALAQELDRLRARDRKSTRLNSSHTVISYAVFCLSKKQLRTMTGKRRHCQRRNCC